VVPTLPSLSARHCIAHDGYGSNSIASICCEFVVQQIYNNLDDTSNAYNMTTNLQHPNARKVTDTNQQVHSKSATNSQQIEVVESGPISAHYATRMSFVNIYFSITLGDLLEKQLNLLPQMMWNVSPC